MILADTSVWIDFFAPRTNPAVVRLERAIYGREIVVGDLILVELLQGAKGDLRQREISRKLRYISCEVLCGREIAFQSAANYRTLRQRGVTVRGAIDVIIATWCIETGTTLLHNDRDFDPIEQHLGLKVWR